jgi:hypothetical protein
MSSETLILFLVAQLVILGATFWRIEYTRRADNREDLRDQITDTVKIMLAPELRDIDRRLSNIEGQLGARVRSG